MYTYVIGDLHGCKKQLLNLIKLITKFSNFNKIIFTGDLINRGPESLEILRYIRSLGNKAETVLGNHELHFLSISQNVCFEKKTDTFNDILNSPDCNNIVTWIRNRPLAILEKGHLIFHAGVLPQWDVNTAILYARKIEKILRGPNWIKFLYNIYDYTKIKNKRRIPLLNNIQPLKNAINAFTRMRFCTKNGEKIYLEKNMKNFFSHKYYPWFEIPTRKTQNTICIFGHWSQLGLILRQNLIGLDTGCIWGGKLTAIRIEDKKVLQVNCI